VIAVLGLFVAACSWPQLRGDGRHTAVNPFAPGVDSGTVNTLVPAWTNPTPSVSGEVVTLDGRAFVRSTPNAIYAFDLSTGASLWHVDAALTSTFYQIRTLNPPTTIGAGVDARVVVSEYEIAFDPQNPSLFAADGLTRFVDPASGSTLGSITNGGITPPVESDGWVYRPREWANSGIHGTQYHDLFATGPNGAPGFVTILPTAYVTDLVSDGTTTFATVNNVTFAIPAKGCGNAICPPNWQTTFTGKLAIAHGTLFGVTANGSLGAIPTTGCGSTICLPVWSAPLIGEPRGLAVTETRVFATSGSTLATFSTDGCGADTCSPLWSSTTGAGLTAPSVVNDLVFTGGDAGRVQAWTTTGCGSASCDPIASLPQGSSVGNVTPISRALVFVVDGKLRKLVLPD
jgi:outer membrane protein assembly factor BamB